MGAAAVNPSYRVHWGLRETPFPSGLNPRLFHQSPAHEEALARLQFLVEQRQRLGLLLGSTGTGKSLVLDQLARHFRRRGAQVASISLLRVDLHEFLWLLAAELGLNPGRNDDIFSLWRGVMDGIAENRYQQLDTLILLDDADEAQGAVLDHVARLAQCDPGVATPLSLVLSVSPERVSRLGPRLLDLAELRTDLDPWDEQDTHAYLTAALAWAGRKTPLFTDDAVNRLQHRSGGVPRRVNQLAALALVAGAGRWAKPDRRRDDRRRLSRVGRGRSSRGNNPLRSRVCHWLCQCSCARRSTTHRWQSQWHINAVAPASQTRPPPISPVCPIPTLSAALRYWGCPTARPSPMYLSRGLRRDRIVFAWRIVQRSARVRRRRPESV